MSSMKRINRRLLTAALALCLAAACCLCLGTTGAQAAESREKMDPADIYEQNVNSTVGIRTTITTNIWGYQTLAAASGSGFIITDDGYILTNYHVVADADTITVTLYSGDDYDARLVGYDESNDIAVLKVDGTGLDPVTVGDSGALRVGDSVLAIGNPLGELTFSLTGGMVSALDREITVSTGVTMDLIQTDCAINSGNSGGALFNMYGEVVGITNAKFSTRSGISRASIDNIGFAIPISRVYDIVESIMTDGTVTKPYIGVTVSDMSPDVLAYGLPNGAAVRTVNPDTPAQEAGIQENDIITGFDGQEITGREALSKAISDSQIGSKHTLTVYRQGESLDLTVEIGQTQKDALPDEGSDVPSNDPQEQFPDSFEEFMKRFSEEQAS